MKVKCESEVAQLCPTLSDPTDCSLPGFSVHGIFQARVLEWGAILPLGFPKCNDFFKEFDSSKALEAGYQVTSQKVCTSNVANEGIVPS